MQYDRLESPGSGRGSLGQPLRRAGLRDVPIVRSGQVGTKQPLPPAKSTDPSELELLLIVSYPRVGLFGRATHEACSLDRASERHTRHSALGRIAVLMRQSRLIH